ncbi:hypothetical protein [Streptomyces sp. NPDC091879]
MTKRKVWLPIPVFAQRDGNFTHAQRLQILDTAYAMTTPDAPAVTS